MPGLARRHHVVSKFYLRHFANDEGQLRTVELPGNRSFYQSIEDATVERDFYLVDLGDEQQSDVVESAFGYIETDAAQVWRAVVEGLWPLPDHPREIVAGWVALQLLRSKAQRTTMSNLATGMTQLDIAIGGREGLASALADAGRPTDPKSVDREWVELFVNPVELEATPNDHVKLVAELLPRVVENLMSRWWVLTTYDRRSLATSDHPVVVIPNERDLELGLGTGIETADHITLPFSRRLALSMATRDSLPHDVPNIEDGRQPGSTQTALFSNSATVGNARRFLYHHPHDNPLMGLPLVERRTREVSVLQDVWRFMSVADRQVLLDAGVNPPIADEG